MKPSVEDKIATIQLILRNKLEEEGKKFSEAILFIPYYYTSTILKTLNKTNVIETNTVFSLLKSNLNMVSKVLSYFQKHYFNRKKHKCNVLD